MYIGSGAFGLVERLMTTGTRAVMQTMRYGYSTAIASGLSGNCIPPIGVEFPGIQYYPANLYE